MVQSYWSIKFFTIFIPKQSEVTVFKITPCIFSHKSVINNSWFLLLFLIQKINLGHLWNLISNGNKIVEIKTGVFSPSCLFNLHWVFGKIHYLILQSSILHFTMILMSTMILWHNPRKWGIAKKNRNLPHGFRFSFWWTM